MCREHTFVLHRLGRDVFSKCLNTTTESMRNSRTSVEQATHNLLLGHWRGGFYITDPKVVWHFEHVFVLYMLPAYQFNWCFII